MDIAFYLLFEIFLSTILCEANVSVRTWTSSAWAPRWDPRLTRMTSSAPLPPSRQTPPAPAANGAAGRQGSAAPPPTEGPRRKRGPTGRRVFWSGFGKYLFSLRGELFSQNGTVVFHFLDLLPSGSSQLPRLVKLSKFFNYFFSFQVSYGCGIDSPLLPLRRGRGGREGWTSSLDWLWCLERKGLFWIREIGRLVAGLVVLSRK